MTSRVVRHSSYSSPIQCTRVPLAILFHESWKPHAAHTRSTPRNCASLASLVPRKTNNGSSK